MDDPLPAEPGGRSLFLFTIGYPFGTAEPFVESELRHLAAQFDRIFIQPMQGYPILHNVPTNVRVYPPLFITHGDKLRLYLRAALRPRMWCLVWSELRRSSKAEGRARFSTFLKIALWSIYKVTLENSAFCKMCVCCAGSKIAYSYWGHMPSLALETLTANSVPMVVRYHRVDLYGETALTASNRYLRSSYMPWFDRVANRATKLLFISDHGKNYFRKNWPPSEGRENQLLTARLGVDDAGTTPPHDDRSPALVLASCSRVTRVKRVHLIAGLADALSRHIPVVWHHFGDGDLQETRRRLAECDPTRLQAHLHGYVPNSDVRRFYRENRIDLFVNLSESEGLPVSIMEAISAGIPVFATATNGTDEAVLAERSGLTCTVEEALDSDALARKIVGELRENRLARLSPRQVWAERFDASRNYAELADQLIAAADSMGQTAPGRPAAT